MKAIETKELTKNYGEFCAVDGLNLTIDQGELFSLLGLNAAGKTTTIKMLACLMKPTSGDATILGESINDNPHKIKKNINISPQETAIASNLTVQENLEFIAGVYGASRSDAVGSAREMGIKLGLESVYDKKAKVLSGGMQRRLSIAMSLISNPKVLFLDEPTLGLDVIARRELWKVIKELKGKVTILLTTHYLEEAEALSDRVGIMKAGKLVAVGRTDELTKATKTKSLEEAFIVISGEIK